MKIIKNQNYFKINWNGFLFWKETWKYQHHVSKLIKINWVSWKLNIKKKKFINYSSGEEYKILFIFEKRNAYLYDIY